MNPTNSQPVDTGSHGNCLDPSHITNCTFDCPDPADKQDDCACLNDIVYADCPIHGSASCIEATQDDKCECIPNPGHHPLCPASNAYKQRYAPDSPQASETETMESVFAGLPNGCTLKTPNNYQADFTCVYKEHTKKSIRTSGKTPSEAVVRLAELLATAEEARNNG